MRADDCACLMASFVKEAPSLWGIAKAIERQANRQITTFILLQKPKARKKKEGILFIWIFKLLFMLIVFGDVLFYGQEIHLNLNIFFTHDSSSEFYLHSETWTCGKKHINFLNVITSHNYRARKYQRFAN